MSSLDLLTPQEIKSLVAQSDPLMSANDHDEMAIPSYLHGNPIIRWLMWKRYQVIHSFLPEIPMGTALEFGCGLGLFLPTLCSRYAHVGAIDLFPGYAKRLCESRALPLTFFGGIEKVQKGSVDVLVAADVLEHVENLEELLKSFGEVLKPGGCLIVSGPTENWMYRIGRVLAGFSGKGDYHHTNIHRLHQEIELNGFILKASRNLPFFFPPHLFQINAYRSVRRQ